MKCILLLIIAMFITGCSSQVSSSIPAQSVSIEASPIPTILEKEKDVLSIEKWDESYVSGYLITTEHYRIHSTLDDLLLNQRIPAFLEALHKEFRRVSGVKAFKAQPNDIYIFATREQWEMFSQAFTMDYWPYFKNIKNGAFYHNGACVAYNLGLQNTLSLLGHECWHQFSRRHFKYQLPAWVDEGMAMSFEGVRYEDGQFSFSPEYDNARIEGLKVAIADNYDVSFSELLEINPATLFKSNDKGKINAYYSKLYAFTRFLTEYDNQSYAPKFAMLLRDGYYGKWDISENIIVNLQDRNLALTTSLNRIAGVEVFEEYFGKNYKKMEQDYKIFVYSLISAKNDVNIEKRELDSPGLSMYNSPAQTSMGNIENNSKKRKLQDSFDKDKKQPGLGSIGKSSYDKSPGL